MSKIYLAIAFIAAALLIGGVLLWPKYQSLNILNEGIKVKELELQSKTDYFDHIRGVSEQLEEYQDPLSKINSALPNDALLPSTFNFLQNAASQAGLILEEVAVGSVGVFGQTQASPTKPAEGQIKTVSLNLSLVGSYVSLKSFVSEIENSARIIEIRKIAFSSPEEDEEEDAFTFSVDVVTHNY
ncbi:MAG: type 4a pilus biogenesis protein PilO [Candidatus Pacebacteria bacterium]|nr:type 4a pilus biogenesis protein PilO [Candidatus Paceibacterota bacterium]